MLVLFLQIISFAQEEIIHKGNLYYLSNTLVVKVKDNYTGLPKTLNKTIPNFVLRGMKQLFPAQPVLNKEATQLSKIYLLSFNSSEDPTILAAKISKTGNFEWVEPKYIRRVTYTPNDSLYVRSLQKNLQRIFADSAWAVTIGDTSIHIGIVDTGVDWNHPDLASNVLKDKSGNLVGYDLGGLNGTPDNDPSEDYSPLNRYHGTHVAGIADAVTDNRIGIASIGFKCTLIPVKVARDDKRDDNGTPYIYYGFEGIKWAVDHGAKVINCSWGGSAYSLSEQLVIDYAVSKGTLVVAAAGNDGKLENFYPACYKGVLAVGWLDTNDDIISSAANFGRLVDVFSPGSLILSTWPRISGQLYNSISGSSMASPLVAGLAGLVFSRFPNYTPLQVAEQIRVTADNIEPYNTDTLKYLLGRGRINANHAVRATNKISVRAVDVKFIDEGNGNGLLESNENASIEINFTNYLNPISNVTISLETSDNAVTILNSIFQTGAVLTLGTIGNQANKFRFKINPGAPINHDVNFLIKYSGNNYSDFQWITARINPTYGTHNVGRITMTVTSKGTLAFDDYPTNLLGDGFKFANGDNLMFEGALMYGTTQNKVMSESRVLENQNTSFTTITPFKIKNVGSDQQGSTVFSDAGALTNALGIETHLTSNTYGQAPNDNFAILDMFLKNTTQKNITNLYVGFYIDWDLPQDNPVTDSTYFDTTDNFAVALDETGSSNAFVGTALISSDKYGYYPIDNDATSGDVVMNDVNGFSDAEKWITLSSGIKNKPVGSTDISLVVSGGPFSIETNGNLEVAFSIAAGSSLAELKTAIRQSRIKFKDTTGWIPEILPSDFMLYQNYPNPFNAGTIINYYLPRSTQVTIKLYDILGRKVATLIDEFQQAGIHNARFLSQNFPVGSGVYFYRIQAGDFSAVKKMIFMK